MEKHSLTALFDPELIWVLCAPGSTDVAVAREALGNHLVEGRARIDVITPVLLAAQQPAMHADLAWLLMDIGSVARVLPALQRWRIEFQRGGRRTTGAQQTQHADGSRTGQRQ